MAADAHKNRIALVAGSTGLVGRECVRLLSNNDNVGEVRALVRRPLPTESVALRVRECRTDFDHIDSNPDWFDVDSVFCALGTTMSNAGSRKAFRLVDYEYPLAIAKNARKHGASHFLLVSAAGADSRSLIFYNRVKGELEEAVQRLGYTSVTIARPSLLLGDRQERRLGEEVAKRFGWLMPARWAPVHASQVASALVRASNEAVPGVKIVENAVLRAAAWTN